MVFVYFLTRNIKKLICKKSMKFLIEIIFSSLWISPIFLQDSRNSLLVFWRVRWDLLTTFIDLGTYLFKALNSNKQNFFPVTSSRVEYTPILEDLIWRNSFPHVIKTLCNYSLNSNHKIVCGLLKL